MEKTLPYNIDAERGVLGSALLDRDAITAVDGWLRSEHFYVEKHAWVYEAMLACYHQRIPPDTMSVADELRRRERLEAIGGIHALIDLPNAVLLAAHIDHYGRIVERAAVLRQLISAGGRIAALGFDECSDLEATLDAAESELFTISQRRSVRDFTPIGHIVDAYFAQLREQENQFAGIVGVPTGYKDLDEITGGLHPSDLVVIAARPSVGKTALALSIAYNVGMGGRGKVGMFSLEMSEEQLIQRMLAMHTGIDVQRQRTGRLGDREREALVDAMGPLSSLDITIDDTAGQSLSTARAKARRLKAESGLDLLIVDYLQLLHGRRQENRVQEVSEIARGLKDLARELQVPVLALSQLSRQVEGRQSKVPMLSDLRESGEIEQAADMVIFIHREELYDKETDKKGIAELHIAKHRNGPLAVIPLRFDGPTTRFQNLAYRGIEGYS